jgi:hypothetical protein
LLEISAFQVTWGGQIKANIQVALHQLLQHITAHGLAQLGVDLRGRLDQLF